MLVHIFCDETGTITNSNVPGKYGLGWVFVEDSKLSAMKDLLRSESLHEVHMSKLTSDEERLEVAGRIGALSLHSKGVCAGALIREDSDFANRIVEKRINNLAVMYPDEFLKPVKGWKNQPLIKSPKDLIPDKYRKWTRNIRIQELAGIVTRYAVFQILRCFKTCPGIHVHISSVSDKEMHLSAIKIMERHLIHGLNELIDGCVRNGYLEIASHCGPSDIFITVEDDASHLFGLADFCAYTARIIAADDSRAKTLGIGLYECASDLFFPLSFPETTEVCPGIFLRRASEEVE